MLIGLNGLPGSGKDEVYEILSGLLEMKVRRVAFADKMKVSAARSLGFKGTDEEAFEYCNVLKSINNLILTPDSCLSGREYIENYGTEGHRDVFGEDFWVDATLPRDFDHSNGLTVVTDVRFDNEAERVRDLGGEVWLVERNLTASNHASQQPISNKLIDKVLLNTGTKTELTQRLMTVMEKYL